MLANAFVDNAKVMAKGQVTIPKDVRKVLGVTSGDRTSFIVEGGTVLIVNSAVYAMQMLQGEMADETKRADLTSDDDVMTLVKELRNVQNVDEMKRIINKKIPPVRLHISSAQVVWRCPSPSRHKAFPKVLVVVCGKIRTKNFFDLIVFHFNNSICIFTDFFIMSYHNNCFFQLYFYLE